MEDRNFDFSKDQKYYYFFYVDIGTPGWCLVKTFLFPFFFYLTVFICFILGLYDDGPVIKRNSAIGLLRMCQKYV